MKKNHILIVAFLYIITIQAQNIKTYSGDFKKGKATYSYYENSNYERIYEGKFSYKYFVNYNHYQNVIISGEFSNNLKSGIWQYKGYDEPNSNSNDQLTINGSYIKGKKNGKWSLKRVALFPLNKNNSFTQEMILNFKNDTLINDFSYTNSKENISIKGKFNRIGNYDGEWRSVGNILEDIRVYRNGFLTFRLLKNKATGEVYDKKDFNAILPYVIFDKDSLYSGTTIKFGNKYVIEQFKIKDEEWIKTKDGENNLIECLDFPAINYWTGEFNSHNLGIENLIFDFEILTPDNPIIGATFYGIYDHNKIGVNEKIISNYDFNTLILNINSQKELYASTVKEGYDALDAKDYNKALSSFQLAQNYKVEQNVSNKILELEKTKAENTERLKSIIEEADDLLEYKKEFDNAILKYNEALTITFFDNSKIKVKSDPAYLYKRIEDCKNGKAQIQKNKKLEEEKKKDLEDFIVARIKTNYDLKLVKPEELNKIENKIHELCFNFLKENMFENMESQGKLQFIIDTNGVIKFDYSKIICDNKKYVNFIKNNMQSISSNIVYLNDYKINCSGDIDITSKSYVGKTDIEYRMGTNPVSYPDKEPSIEVKNAILKKTKSSQLYSNGYKLKFEFISVGNLSFENIEILKSLR